MDASMERRAPHDNNPVPATDANLIDGMKIYTMNCASCHGGLDKKPNPFGANFYPPVPQLILDPPDDFRSVGRSSAGDWQDGRGTMVRGERNVRRPTIAYADDTKGWQ